MKYICKFDCNECIKTFYLYVLKKANKMKSHYICILIHEKVFYVELFRGLKGKCTLL